MKYFVATFTMAVSFFIASCSKSSLEKIDLEAIKKKAVGKQEDLKKIQEKVKKIKKKL